MLEFPVNRRSGGQLDEGLAPRVTALRLPLRFGKVRERQDIIDEHLELPVSRELHDRAEGFGAWQYARHFYRDAVLRPDILIGRRRQAHDDAAALEHLVAALVHVATDDVEH